jgi:nucleoside-diphosphate-sugar epimerase
MATSPARQAEFEGKIVLLNEACDGWAGPPRNKYGRSKLEAECCVTHHHSVTGLPVVILRTSRFFPEDEIHPAPNAVSTPNMKANELLGRRVALADLIDAHLRALLQAPGLRCSLFTLSAPSPLAPPLSALLAESHVDTPSPPSPDPATLLPSRARSIFAQLGWRLPESCKRVYLVDKALRSVSEGGLGWRPQWTFDSLLDRVESALASRTDQGSDKDREIGVDALMGRY